MSTEPSPYVALNQAIANKADDETIWRLYKATDQKLDKFTPTGFTSFHALINCGREAIVRRILSEKTQTERKALVNQRANKDGLTSLHILAKNSNDWSVSMGRLLVANGADVSARTTDKHVSTPAHYAISNRRFKFLEFLLDAGADLFAERQGYPEKTPIEAACVKATDAVAYANLNEIRKVILAELVKRAAIEGAKPLHIAVKLGLTSLVREMLQVGTEDVYKSFGESHSKDVNAKTADGLTPLHYACGNKNIDPEIIALLLREGADVNAVTNDGVSPVLAAVIKHNLAAVKVLLSHTVRPKLCDLVASEHTANSSLLTAIQCLSDQNASDDAIEIAKLLVNFATEDEVRKPVSASEGITLLHYVCHRSGTGVIGQLAKRLGVDVRTGNGFTPLHLVALGKGSPGVGIFLLSIGADPLAEQQPGNSKTTPYFFVKAPNNQNLTQAAHLREEMESVLRARSSAAASTTRQPGIHVTAISVVPGFPSGAARAAETDTCAPRSLPSSDTSHRLPVRTNA